jgi:Mn2+/Fe2+ NRAMP family transporter
MLWIMKFWNRSRDMARSLTARPSQWLSVLFIVSTMAMTATQTLAQSTDAAPLPSLSRTPSPLIGYGIMAVFAIAIVAVSLLPSKRGHQD